MPSPFFERGSKIVDVLFASNPTAQRNADRVRKDEPIESMLGMMSNSPEMLEICDRLDNKLTERLPETVDDMGRCSGNGVRGPFHGLRHVPGFPMKNGTWPLTDNIKKRKDDGLSNTWVEPWHRELFSCFTRVFFEDLESVDMRLRKGSSSVIPIFTTDAKDKRNLALAAMQEAEDAGNMWLKGDFKGAYLQHHFGGASYVVYRGQNSDKITYNPKTGKYVPKDRYVADMEYAITGGVSGYQRVSSKELDDVEWPHPEGFFRTRLRTAMGLSYKTSTCQMPVFQATRKKLYKLYSFSFHHTTRMQKEEKLRQWDHVTFADVSDHDINWAKKLYMPEVKDVLLSMGWSDWGVELMIRSLDLPIYVSSPAVGEGHVLLGHPWKPDVNVGLPSGNPGTDIWGTLGMAFNYCLVQLIHTAPEYISEVKNGRGLAFVRRYLAGGYDFATMSKSDDAAMVWRTPKYASKALKLHERMRDDAGFFASPYVKISFEYGGKFLGDMALYSTTKETKSIIMVGDILSSVYNTFIPEYSVDSKQEDRTRVKRSYPGLAWTTHAQVFGSHPSFGVVAETIEQVFRDVTGQSYQVYRADWEARDKRALSDYLRRKQAEFPLDDLTTPELEVLIQSEKLQYKYTEDEVRAEVIEISEFRIPKDHVAPYLQKFTNQRYV